MPFTHIVALSRVALLLCCLIWIYFIYCLFSCIRLVVFIYRLVNKVDQTVQDRLMVARQR